MKILTQKEYNKLSASEKADYISWKYSKTSSKPYLQGAFDLAEILTDGLPDEDPFRIKVYHMVEVLNKNEFNRRTELKIK